MYLFDRKKSHRQGFSLIELLLVLAVLVLIGALVFQTLSGTLTAAELSQSAQQVRTVFTDAKLKAIDLSQPVVLRVRLGSGEYKLEPAFVSATPDASAATSVVTSPTESQSQAGSLEEGVVFRSVNCTSIDGQPVSMATQPPSEGEWSSPIVFMPTGVSYNAELVIGHAGEGRNPERQRKIVLRGITCTASVSEVDPSGATF